MKKFLNLSIEELFNYILENIKYGWIDTKGIPHYSSNNDDFEYHLQTPKQMLERKIAICWDKCELLRYYFEKNNYNYDTYFIYLYINDDYCPSHSMLVFENKGTLVWFEPSESLINRGINYYKNEEDFLLDMKSKFIKNGLRNNYFTETDDLTKLYCYKYEKTSYGIKGSEFYNYCRTGKKIYIKN